MSASAEYHDRHDVTRFSLFQLAVTGPAVDDLTHRILNDLADSIHAGDSRAAAWTDYLLARSALLNAVEDGTAGDWHEDRAADAWDVLAADISHALVLHAAQGRQLAGELDEACGRVGETRTT